MDPIGDFLTQIRNATSNQHEKIIVSSSKMKTAISKTLREEGFIKDFKTIIKKNQILLTVWLEYSSTKHISHLKRVSKPGLRVYTSWKEIPRVLGGWGMVIISTPRGVMSGREATRKRIGGEIICEVY